MRKLTILGEGVVPFKSEKRFFCKEVEGLKNNTMRYVDMEEDKFKYLAFMALTGEFGEIEISEIKQIKKSVFEFTGRKFKKRIRDVTFWNKYVCITWEH